MMGGAGGSEGRSGVDDCMRPPGARADGAGGDAGDAGAGGKENFRA